MTKMKSLKECFHLLGGVVCCTLDGLAERAAREAREIADALIKRDNTGDVGVSMGATLARIEVRACQRVCRFLLGTTSRPP